MRFKVGFATDIGLKRSQNQDHATAHPELGLFVVADGMGGHRGGEIASAMAVETIAEKVRKGESESPKWSPSVVLLEAIRAANQTIFNRALSQAQLQGMGTTTTALLFKDSNLTIGHVGDSRCYYFTPNALWQVTRDHSLVQEKLRVGLITRNQAKTDKMKNVITRSVGFEPEVNIEVYQMMTQPEDCFLVCSDGLSGMLDDARILEVVQKNMFESPESNTQQQTVDALVELAKQSGGDDNITAILIKLEATNGDMRAPGS